MVDPVQQTAATGDKDSGADIIDERLLFDGALEQLKSLAQSQMNNRVKGFALDFFAGKTGIVLEHDRFAGKAIAEDAAAFFGLKLFRARHRDPQSHRDVVS